ncbi:MAG: response regulator transcription factor [Dehalococcoidia bacterium]|nr:MAG: response regulator transcription factor [Dehalococcoidia bacterium]
MSITTLMIIDSQQYFIAEIRKILSQASELDEIEIFACDPGPDGNEAIAKIEEKCPDIVLLDIEYPFLNGLEIGKKIACRYPGTPVVMLSVNPGEDYDELFEAIKSGAAAYLKSMTCSPSELANTIKRVSNGEYAINDTVSNQPKVALRILRHFQEMTTLDRRIEQITTPLTYKEEQILRLIAQGNPNKSICKKTGISEQTLKNHISGILRKLNANVRARDVFTTISDSLIPSHSGRD